MQASNAQLVVELGGSDRGIDNGDNDAVGCKLLLITGHSMFSADLLAALAPTPGSTIRDVPELTLTMYPARRVRQHLNEGDLVPLLSHYLTETAT